MKIIQAVIFFAIQSLVLQGGVLDKFKLENKLLIGERLDKMEIALSKEVPADLFLSKSVELFPLGYIKQDSVVSNSEIAAVASSIVRIYGFDDIIVLSAINYIETDKTVFLLRPAVYEKIEEEIFTLDLGYPRCGILIEDVTQLEMALRNMPIRRLREIRAEARWQRTYAAGRPLNEDTSVEVTPYKPPVIEKYDANLK